ncbi:hypothetical protein DFH09DRAFT_1457633 [Mycena vulgaris]|nr:hypothetical protein DFH09DRAFT_1457633 [Mycena vulgaris]
MPGRALSCLWASSSILEQRSRLRTDSDPAALPRGGFDGRAPPRATYPAPVPGPSAPETHAQRTTARHRHRHRHTQSLGLLSPIPSSSSLRNDQALRSSSRDKRQQPRAQTHLPPAAPRAPRESESESGRALPWRVDLLHLVYYTFLAPFLDLRFYLGLHFHNDAPNPNDADATRPRAAPPFCCLSSDGARPHAFVLVEVGAAPTRGVEEGECESHVAAREQTESSFPDWRPLPSQPPPKRRSLPTSSLRRHARVLRACRGGRPLDRSAGAARGHTTFTASFLQGRARRRAARHSRWTKPANEVRTVHFSSSSQANVRCVACTPARRRPFSSTRPALPPVHIGFAADAVTHCGHRKRSRSLRRGRDPEWRARQGDPHGVCRAVCVLRSAARAGRPQAGAGGSSSQLAQGVPRDIERESTSSRRALASPRGKRGPAIQCVPDSSSFRIQSLYDAGTHPPSPHLVRELPSRAVPTCTTPRSGAQRRGPNRARAELAPRRVDLAAPTPPINNTLGPRRPREREFAWCRARVVIAAAWLRSTRVSASSLAGRADPKSASPHSSAEPCALTRRASSIAPKLSVHTRFAAGVRDLRGRGGAGSAHRGLRRVRLPLRVEPLRDDSRVEREYAPRFQCISRGAGAGFEFGAGRRTRARTRARAGAEVSCKIGTCKYNVDRN